MTGLADRIAAEKARRPVLTTESCAECGERLRHAIRCSLNVTEAASIWPRRTFPARDETGNIR